MEATAWKGQSFEYPNRIRYGLRVGAPNRDRYFERSWSSVCVDFPNGRIVEIRLLGGFWNRCPELRHEAFGAWYQELGVLPWRNGHPPKFILERVGVGRFRLTRV
jgi:hypothetical protein